MLPLLLTILLRPNLSCPFTKLKPQSVYHYITSGLLQPFSLWSKEIPPSRLHFDFYSSALNGFILLVHHYDPITPSTPTIPLLNPLSSLYQAQLLVFILEGPSWLPLAPTYHPLQPWRCSILPVYQQQHYSYMHMGQIFKHHLHFSFYAAPQYCNLRRPRGASALGANLEEEEMQK